MFARPACDARQSTQVSYCQLHKGLAAASFRGLSAASFRADKRGTTSPAAARSTLQAERALFKRRDVRPRRRRHACWRAHRGRSACARGAGLAGAQASRPAGPFVSGVGSARAGAAQRTLKNSNGPAVNRLRKLFAPTVEPLSPPRPVCVCSRAVVIRAAVHGAPE